MAPRTEDEQAVIDRTDQWLNCAVVGDATPLHEILADDYRYSGHPRFGAEVLNKRQMIEVASLLSDDGTEKLEHYVRRVGDTIVSTTLTRSMETIDSEASAASSAEMNEAMKGKLLLYVSGWRNEDGAWRCFDMHLVDAS